MEGMQGPAGPWEGLTWEPGPAEGVGRPGAGGRPVTARVIAGTVPSVPAQRPVASEAEGWAHGVGWGRRWGNRDQRSEPDLDG